MKKKFVYASILCVCFIQACNSSSAPAGTADDSTTNDSAYDRITATERAEKTSVKKENGNNESIKRENTKKENGNNENAQKENSNNENINNESTQREDTNNENINDENPEKQNVTGHNTIHQETLNNNNRVHVNANEIPDAVISALHMRYPTVFKVNWVMSDNRKKTLYIAHWQTHKNKWMAVFDQDGMLIKEKQYPGSP